MKIIDLKKYKKFVERTSLINLIIGSRSFSRSTFEQGRFLFYLYIGTKAFKNPLDLKKCPPE
jgi:hypothetical protein